VCVCDWLTDYIHDVIITDDFIMLHSLSISSVKVCAFKVANNNHAITYWKRHVRNIFLASSSSPSTELNARRGDLSAEMKSDDDGTWRYRFVEREETLRDKKLSEENFYFIIQMGIILFFYEKKVSPKKERKKVWHNNNVYR
jgi:hypothetical protein